MASTRPAPTTNHLSTVPRSSRLNIRTAGAERDLSSVRQLKTHCAAAITAAPASQADWACLANMLGAPALSFPCPTEGLPVSCQLLAAPGQDERLLSLACALDTFWG